MSDNNANASAQPAPVVGGFDAWWGSLSDDEKLRIAYDLPAATRAAWGAALSARPAVEGVVVERNSCTCHPETCCCPDYGLLVGLEVVATGSKEAMEKLATFIHPRPVVEGEFVESDVLRKLVDIGYCTEEEIAHARIACTTNPAAVEGAQGASGGPSVSFYTWFASAYPHINRLASENSEHNDDERTWRSFAREAWCAALNRVELSPPPATGSGGEES